MLQFLYAPEPGEHPTEKMWRENKLELQFGVMGLDPHPTTFEVAEDLYEAMMAYQHKELMGPPYAGGSLSQPVWWVEAIMCVMTAKQKASETKQVRERRAASQK